MRDVPEMVTKVAKAISGAPFPSAASIAKARRAIEAMREPSQAMTKAGVDFALGVSLSGDYCWTDYISDMHRRQIDTALTAPAEPPRS